jgi:aryl-alcohol dehydrogenase-like predicted oxidoreductase
MTDPIFAPPRRVPPRKPRLARWALGTAVLGRPAYINTGSGGALPADRSVDGFRQNTFRILDAALAGGVEWIDTARSYGRAEEFVGQWWRARSAADPAWLDRAPTVSSKWGYAYVGEWNPAADVHEVKDHSLAQFEKQWSLSRRALPHVNLYQVHSLTLDSPLFTDGPLLDALAGLRDSGVAIGFSTSGPGQGDTILAAMELQRGQANLFSAVQATWNLLETSAAAALRVASRRELTVIVKEALANGRLATDPPPEVTALAHRRGATPDAVALAAAAMQPWADRVLLGAASADQLGSNLAATGLVLSADELAGLTADPQEPTEYWQTRAGLAWQ